MRNLSFMVIGFSLFFTSCQKDDHEQKEQKSASSITEEKIDYNAFSKRVNTEKLTKSFLGKNKSLQDNARLSDYEGLLINTDEILVINNQGHITYTFNIKESGNYKDLINLVIDEKDNGEAEEKIIVYRNYLINNKQTDDVVVIKPENISNAVSRLVDITGALTCFRVVSVCNLGGEGHYSGHHDCTHGTSWYLNYIEVDCPPGNSGGIIHHIADTGDGADGSSGGSSFYYLQTPCSQSMPPQINQQSNVEQNSGILENGSENKTTTRPLMAISPLDAIDLTNEEQMILDMHPGLYSILNNYALANPDSEEVIKSVLQSLYNTALNDALNNTNQYETLLCGNSSQQPLHFISEGLNTLVNGGEVDFALQVIVDSSFEENDCVYGIYENAGLAPTFNNYLRNFNGEFSVAHLKLSVGTDGNHPEAHAVTYTPDNSLIELRFNPNKLDRPRLDVFRTFVHEIIHAEIFRKLLSCSELPHVNIDNYTQEQYTNLMINLSNNFPGLLDYYIRYSENEGNLSGFHHDMMAQHYIGIIVAALKEFDNNAHSDEFYTALAWVGLMGKGVINGTTGLPVEPTVAWQNVPQAQRLQILDIYETFKNSNTLCQ